MPPTTLNSEEPLKRACQISHGVGAPSFAVIPVSRELCDAV